MNIEKDSQAKMKETQKLLAGLTEQLGSLDAGLEVMKRLHGIKGKVRGNYLILDYSQFDVNWTEPYGYVCRGLVLDVRTLNVAAFGLGKFFNEGDHYQEPIDWKTAKAFEKLDGTMVQRFWDSYRMEFVFSTRFQLPEDLAVNKPSGLSDATWQNVIDGAIASTEGMQAVLDTQRTTETFTLEVQSPLNQIVVRQRVYKANLLAIRDNVTLEERSVEGLATAPVCVSFDSAGSVKGVADTLHGTESEGFVVVDGNFNRVKIKGESYVRLHHLASGINTTKNLILLARTNDYDDVSTNFPQYKEFLDSARDLIAEIYARHEAAWAEHSGIKLQKDFAVAIQALGLENIHSLFKLRTKKAKTIREAMELMTEDSYCDMVTGAMAPGLKLDLGPGAPRSTLIDE